MKPRTIFITGTDTGVGKTVVACALARHWRAQKISVAAFKPVCSGDRGDAVALRSASGGELSLDEINPWHFRAAISPLLAARAENRKVKLADVTARSRRLQNRFSILIVEGAGGLLSPLGEDFDSRDLIKTLRAIPVIVAMNRLGVINQILLTLEALPETAARRSQVVLMQLPKGDLAAKGNLKFLSEKLGGHRVHELPWTDSDSGADDGRVRASLETLTCALTSF